MGSERLIPARLGADGWAWELSVTSNATGETQHRLRVRTRQGEKATDLTPADVPVRIAELCTRLGLEGLTMDDDLTLTKLAAMRREQLDDLDGEIAALGEKRKRLDREVKAIEKCAAMLDAPAKSGAARPGAAKAGATGWTPERRAAHAERMRKMAASGKAFRRRATAA